jgi:predicted DNA-binding protein (MmcQ/YjbR family)
MHIEDLQNIVQHFKNITYDMKWENHLCFCVNKKIFMITSPDDYPVNASFKTTPEIKNLLLEREGFTSAPYLGRYNWIKVDDINKLSLTEWQEYLYLAYTLIAKKK